MRVVPGSIVFELKATHGLPFDLIFDLILNVKGMLIDWAGFIKRARLNNWYDYATYDAIVSGLNDTGLSCNFVEGVKERFKLYILTYPMKELA